jgi:hypothetical protein
MKSMTNFNVIAAARGDGLDPKLRELLERAIVSAHSEVIVRAGGMLQAGPNPRSTDMETVSAVVQTDEACARDAQTDQRNDVQVHRGIRLQGQRYVR